MDDKEIGSIDLLLLDIKMPGMNGFVSRDHLSSAGYNIPIVFMTAHEIDKAWPLANGNTVAVILQKPIDKKDLLGKIRNGLK